MYQPYTTSTNPFGRPSDHYDRVQGSYQQPPYPYSHPPRSPVDPRQVPTEHYYGQSPPAYGSDTQTASAHAAREQGYREGYSAAEERMRHEAEYEARIAAARQQQYQARYAAQQQQQQQQHTYWNPSQMPGYAPAPAQQQQQRPSQGPQFPQAQTQWANSNAYLQPNTYAPQSSSYAAWNVRPSGMEATDVDSGPQFDPWFTRRTPSPSAPPLPPKPWGSPTSSAAPGPRPAPASMPSATAASVHPPTPSAPAAATAEAPRPDAPPAPPAADEADTAPPSRAASPPPPARDTDPAAALEDARRAHAARGAALTSLDDLRGAFERLRAEFVPPAALDFLAAAGGGAARSVSAAGVPFPPPPADARAGAVPRLAFTAANKPVHTYDEELQRLLARLDAVDSGGDVTVRDARRALVRTVEGEAVHVERWRARVWIVNGGR